MPRTLDEALRYASLGWHVIPVRIRGKTPLTSSGVKDASKDEVTIRKWFRQWPYAGVAIATGSISGLSVVDIDPRSGGDRSVSELDIPETLTAKTGGGGWHYYFKSDGSPRKTRSSWRPGIDLKCDGGYVVAPPSLHASGETYQWARSGDPAQEPPWLVDACSVEPVHGMVPPRLHSPSSQGFRRVQAYLQKLPPSIQGSDGSGDLMRACGRIAAEVDSGRISSDDGMALAVEYNARAVPPWTRDDLERAINNARRNSVQSPMEDRPKLHIAPRVEAPPPDIGPAKPSESWSERLLWTSTKSGERLVRCIENAVLILTFDQRWSGKLVMDTFSNSVRISSPPWDSYMSDGSDGGKWSDVDTTRLQSWLLREYDLNISETDTYRAMQVVSQAKQVSLPKQWIESLEWDGIKRVDSWLTKYLGVAPSEYSRSVGKWWLISAVARIYSPGSKADHVLVLEGEQGIKKSSALRVLASPEWFNDSKFDIGSKDAYMSIQGRLIVELAELDSLRRSDVETVKAFVTSQFDTYRQPYSRHLITVPRTCVFAGTTNSNDYLNDDTGGRRFWPVKCSNITLDTLGRDREQIWAEAATMFKSGEKWWPHTKEQNISVKDEQSSRHLEDAWIEKIEGWLDDQSGAVSMSDVLSRALSLPVGQWSRSDEIRVAKALRTLGWSRHRLKLGWRYIKN